MLKYQEYSNFLKEHDLMMDTNFTDQVDTMIYKEEKKLLKLHLWSFLMEKSL